MDRENINPTIVKECHNDNDCPFCKEQVNRMRKEARHVRSRGRH